jgi:hypothetical protein
MLKSAILVGNAIASILSISSIANAAGKSNHIITKHNSVYHFNSNLIAKGKKAQIDRQNSNPSNELTGIKQAISEYYKDRNNKEMPLPSEPGGCFFVEVKSLKLVSFSGNDAEVKGEVHKQGYSRERISNKSLEWGYTKTIVLVKGVSSIMLKKSDGKWKVTVASL